MLDTVKGLEQSSVAMNLQPRRLSLSEKADLSFPMEKLQATQPGSIHRYAPKSIGSIWCMALPLTSYMAPRAAFWFVSSERKR